MCENKFKIYKRRKKQDMRIKGKRGGKGGLRNFIHRAKINNARNCLLQGEGGGGGIRGKSGGKGHVNKIIKNGENIKYKLFYDI